jgi:hypothetical protein
MSSWKQLQIQMVPMPHKMMRVLEALLTMEVVLTDMRNLPMSMVLMRNDGDDVVSMEVVLTDMRKLLLSVVLMMNDGDDVDGVQ